jgi:hypothetical protein
MARIDPHSFFDTAQPQVKHVRLRWQVDFHTQQISGDATLIFATPSAGRVDLTQERRLPLATPTGSHAIHVADQSYPGSKLQLDLPANTSEVTITYSTSPEAALVARSGPDRGKRHRFCLASVRPSHTALCQYKTRRACGDVRLRSRCSK